MGPFREGWTAADVEIVIARDDPSELLYVPIVVSLDPPDGDWAEAVCVRLAAHPHPQVRANSILGFGHLARTSGKLNEAVVRPIIEQGLNDAAAEVRRHATDAACDIAVFLGWQIET